jgi:hypothetical protein
MSQDMLQDEAKGFTTVLWHTVFVCSNLLMNIPEHLQTKRNKQYCAKKARLHKRFTHVVALATFPFTLLNSM